MAVGEIFLSAFITLLFEKLLSHEFVKHARREGLHASIKKLENTLREIKKVVKDAEEKQISDEDVKLWLEELRDLAYDADDILDEFATEALRRALMAEPQSSTSKVRCLIPSCSTGFGPTALVFNLRIRPKIKEINRRLEEIATRKTTLGLVEKLIGETSRKEWKRPPTTSLVIEPFIHGRNKDKEEIIELILKDAPSENKVAVIPIVGMGGIGKSTLVQHVYNDEQVENHFNLKAWVCVSDENFDVRRITKAILESFTLKPWFLKELNALQVKLNETLTGKKFLLVLDDVWNMRSYDEWNVLRSPFRAGAHGSKIIVTTRDSDVALQMGTVNHHRLEKLSNDDCWLIFAQHAFQNTNIREHPSLELIGKKIVENCRGLPLAARTLGSLLRFKTKDNEWEDVLNSKIWKLSKENDVLAALKVSYQRLPSHLKRCFDYCAVIPKDCAFEEEEIVLLWMAEGLIPEPEGNQKIEDLGCEYFCELVSRSFFQSSRSNKSQFIMHDLINDLAQVVAGKICFRLESKLEAGGSQNKISKNARHLSYTSNHYDGIKRFEVLREAKFLRTFLRYTSSDNYYTSNFLTNYVLCDLLPKLKCLRVLSLSKYEITELPDSIGDLKHLRYLNLSYTLIKRLPESVANLYNLQVLLLKRCYNLEELPLNMGNMIKLRHLDTTNARIKEMPVQMGKLTNLQTLSNFIVGKGGGSSIRELRNLQHLRGTISISGLENVIDACDAREANLNDKHGVKELFLEWLSGSQSLGIQKDVLDFLQPHLNLEELIIVGYTGTSLSSWLGDGLFSRMVLLRLEDCQNCKSLPPLGQLPLLKELRIIGMSGVEQLGPEFYGEGCSKPFPSLENLTFMNMYTWKDWFCVEVDKEVEPFTRLINLRIHGCSKLLGKLPKHLPSLKELVIEECPQLVVALLSLGMLRETRNSADLSLLTCLSIRDVPIPVSFCNPDIADEVLLANVATNHLKSLTRLHVNNISKLTSLPLWFIQGLTGLEELNIFRCGELALLWQNEVQLQLDLPALRHLVIKNCPQLFCLFDEKDEEEEGAGGGGGQHEGLPCMRMLEYLEIHDCGKLEKLPQDLHTLTFLGDLTISDCPRLISFPKTGLPSTLRTLTISKCRALETLTEGLMHNNSIEVLDVSDCPSLTSLSSRTALPATLKVLRIFHCKNLESIVVEGLQINSALDSVRIWDCKNLKSLPDGPRNLSQLVISDCDNLEFLSEGWLSTTSVRKLQIVNCKKLEALPNRSHNLTSLQHLCLGGFPGAISYFRQRNFPTNLNSLIIDKLPYPSEWGLHRFSCLRALRIWGSCLDLLSFPDKEGGILLPSSLTELHITDFPNLECLSSEFQDLISLENLTINDCPKLTSLPDQGLPRSLLELQISQCPLLRQRYQKSRGQCWPMIAQIPCVYI